MSTLTRCIRRALSVGFAVLAASTVTIAGPLAPAAQADGCPDIEVVFARGTTEAPGVGRVGQAFISDLRGRVAPRSLGAYAVNYPASWDFLTAADGANDASGHIQWMMQNCPNTRMVLGGYSQGAAVIDVISAIPFPAVGFTAPLPPQTPEHVAAIAVFGNPSTKAGLPLTTSPVWGARAIDLCNFGDPVCSPGEDFGPHRAYPEAGLTSQAAAFAAGLV